jgi:hypothetical protein
MQDGVIISYKIKVEESGSFFTIKKSFFIGGIRLWQMN